MAGACFLPRIDNWATCDLLKPVCFAKNREKLLPCVTRWLGDAHPYTVRFAIEMLMTHYLREDFSPEYPAWVAAVESDTLLHPHDAGVVFRHGARLPV